MAANAPAAPLAGGLEQLADVVREGVRALAEALVHAQPSLWIVQVGAGGMVHGVGAGRGSRLLLVDDLEFLGRCSRRLRVAVEAQKSRVERRHVLREQLRGVALRID